MDQDLSHLHASQLINSIKISEFDSSEFKSTVDIESDWSLTGLRAINLLTGENNSRKSRLLRSIFKSKTTKYESQLLTIDDINNELIDTTLLNSSILGISSNHRETFKACLNSELRGRKIIYSRVFEETVKSIETILRHNFNQVNYPTSFIESTINRRSKLLISNIDHIINQCESFQEKLYIPVLRGLRPLDANQPNTDFYHSRTTKDYFPNSDLGRFIFTGTTLYQELTAHLLGTHQQREIIKSYESYLSKTFFEGRDLSLVPRLNEDVVYLKVGEFERPIFDLGDGIQSLIIITFKVFTSAKPTMFFIEEPEQHLHPGMQRILIDALSRFEQHMYFMTTHSNHLIDIAQEQDNIAVHRVANRSDSDASEITPLTDYSDALADLGVRASSVLLANCSIWVEGITDKFYLRVFLEKYLSNLEHSTVDAERKRAEKLRPFKENLHYVFTEYQGSNITHWDFGNDVASDDSSTPAKKLNNKIFLLADRDIEGKGDRVKVLTEKLGDKFHMLKWKEIENHIPFDVLVKTAETRWKTFSGRQEYTFNFQNIKSKRFEKEDEGVGKILELYVHHQPTTSSKKLTKKTKRSFFETDSGTIKDKAKFCQTAVAIMQDEEFKWMLTPELNDLCEAIWTHIEESN
ncbi:ATP-binding protein [Vibrio fluvialis]|uniref:AAA family ATPase n=1 Tax=Vibrio fluvialis TaxID=676 RepID=UPI001F248677|nr:AAA family ATPase [Vibrio fluvialis]MCE7609266.1 ATP-binding protein [Vibrio fluvialis]MCE7621807.1 ATP-binding protein [Vibrio fluvialis]MCE7627818.1 ATP-binding protein [Vibrio fluvialis]